MSRRPKIKKTTRRQALSIAFRETGKAEIAADLLNIAVERLSIATGQSINVIFDSLKREYKSARIESPAEPRDPEISETR